MVVSPDIAARTQTLLADNRVAVTSPSTALVLSDSGETYTCVATASGIRCRDDKITIGSLTH